VCFGAMCAGKKYTVLIVFYANSHFSTIFFPENRNFFALKNIHDFENSLRILIGQNDDFIVLKMSNK
jgi:hypothetical protein